nr:hypothetical protein [Tanacetum cinerariifolium]
MEMITSPDHQETKVHCIITGEESYEEDCSFMLKCHITKNVNDLLEGLRLRVDFPIVLDVTGLFCDELKASLESAGQDSKFGGLYDLVTILTHEGMTAYSGHYIAWAKDHAGTWVEMDDSSATTKLLADLAALSGGDGGQIAYHCIYKARHNDYPSEAKVKRLETYQSYVADLDDIIPILVQKVKDSILQDEDFICVFKRPKKPRSYVADSDDIIPKVVQKVKDAILQDEDFIWQVHTPYNQTNNYYMFAWPPRASTSTSDVTAFLSFFILGVMAFLGLLFAVIPEGFIGKHMSVFSIDILALWIGFASGIALAHFIKHFIL